MSFTTRFSASLGLAALATLAPHALAQGPRVNTNPGMVSGAGMPNVGVVGSGGVPGFAGVYGPGGSAMAGGPSLMGGGQAVNPYALSTVGGYNPYLGTGAGMDASGGYGLSTAGGMGGMGGFGFPGYGFTPNSMGYGYALMGIADYTRASGQYWKDIQSARMSREKVRQEELETARRRVQYEAWYETMRPTAAKMRATEMAADLDLARKDPPDTEIQSARALNILLQAIQKKGRLEKIATSDFSEELLKHINVTAGTSGGSIGMLKDPSKLDWPLPLLESGYDEARKQLTSTLKKAIDTVKDRERPTTAQRKDIDAYFKEINDKLIESVNDMGSTQFIESRRFMNQLGSAIKALKDPNVDNYFRDTWKPKGKNVAELVDNMSKDGITFAPSAPGDEPYYKALYLALRNFEAAQNSDSR